MSAPTARTILRDLNRRRAQAQIATLGDLDDDAHDAVRRALSAVPANARIDLPLLIESVRRDIAARAEAEAERARANSPLKSLRYRLSLISEGRLTELRDHLKQIEARGEKTVDFGPGSPGAAILAKLDCIAARLSKPTGTDATSKLDRALDQLDGIDDAPAPSQRRGVPRVRSKRAVAAMAQSDEQAAPSNRPSPKIRPNSSAGRARAPFFHAGSHGDRPLGCPVGSDYGRWQSPQRPPWLLALDDENAEEMA